MLTNTMKSSAIRVLATLALAAVPGFASPIFVSNFSFEDGPFGTATPCSSGPTCSNYYGAIPSWTSSSVDTSTFGRLVPGTDLTKYLSGNPSDGPTQAFSIGATLSQVVSPTVTLGDMYVLRVDLGNRLDKGFTGSADLLINGKTYAATGSVPAEGTFSTWTATYVGLAADVGQSITIELKANGPQGNFDNVHLDIVPEPASLLLIGSALFVLGTLKRRRWNA